VDADELGYAAILTRVFKDKHGRRQAYKPAEK